MPVRCGTCKEVKVIDVDFTAFKNWQNGELIQDAFPNMPPDERELLISGLCGKCFDQLFEEK